MSSRTPARRRASAHAAATAPGGNSMLELMADSGREQFALCMDAWGAMFRGLDAMRAIQQRAAHEASVRHQATARRWSQGAAPGEWLALPWSLWQDELAGAARCWQELGAAALEAQTEMLGCACGHVFDSESALHGAATLEALEAIPGVRTLADSGAALARHALPH